DDGPEGFEFWIVQDRQGTQVLLSFAHFSEKRVSVEAASVGNVIVPGFDGVTAALAVAVATLAFVGIRRRLTR
ncbi:MAG TPA: MYXO-CTERM sorting domain-containing protein, partial [Candidatus Thermoplasmatota archaeon]